MTAGFVLLALVALQRMAELLWARANTKRLLAEGGYEAGRGHYPFLVGLHGTWLLSLATAVAVAPPLPLSLPALVAFLALQPLRLWVILSLGRRWTTRIIIKPEAPLSRAGPYRFLRHPNYLIVAAEIALLPLVFGQWPIALGFSVANAGLLAWRVAVEDRALASCRALTPRLRSRCE